MATTRSVGRGSGARGPSPLFPGGGGALAGGALAVVALAAALVLGGGLLRRGGSGPGGGLDRLGAVQQVSERGGDMRPGAAVEVGRLAGDIQRFWRRQLSSAGLRYRDARLDVSEGQVAPDCGQRARGLPGCAAAGTVHLDAGVLRALRSRGASSGGLALGYVVAHAYAHHVQRLLGVAGSPVARELQADCLAGVWAYSTRRSGVLGPAALAAALAAASEAASRHAPGGPERLSGRGRAPSGPPLVERLSSFRRGYDTGRGAVCRSLPVRGG